MITNETTDKLSTHQDLMLKLYKHSVSSSAKTKHEYASLNDFRQEMEANFSSPHHKPYDFMLKKALAYRLIFTALGALFFMLSIHIYDQSINWLPYSFIFSNDLTAKNVVLTTCLILSVSAFSISFFISAEKEALHQLIKRTKRKLTRIYNKQNFALASSSNPSDLKRAEKLKQVYHDALEKVMEIEENSKVLLSQIAKSASRDVKKTVKLYNEALLESNDHLHMVVNQFKKTTLFF